MDRRNFLLSVLSPTVIALAPAAAGMGAGDAAGAVIGRAKDHQNAKNKNIKPGGKFDDTNQKRYRSRGSDIGLIAGLVYGAERLRRIHMP